LDAELEERVGFTKLEQSTAIRECAERLRKSMDNLNILGRLDEKATKFIATAASIVRAEQTTRDGSV
jgi:hypothetical protein